MDFRDLEYFSVIAKHGHVGRAAEVLGLSQPALSLSLRRLEKSIQAKVVKRTPKGVELTAVGSTLLAQAKRLQLVRQDVMREIADLSTGRSGHLRVGVSPGVAEDLAGAASAILTNEAPKVTLKIVVTTPDVLPAALRNGELHLYIAGTTPPADIVHEHIFDDQFVVYASAENRLAQRRTIALTDLMEARWAITNAITGWSRLSRALEAENLPPPYFALESN
jgi:DNA-binding transcriptional LysR family regulator